MAGSVLPINICGEIPPLRQAAPESGELGMVAED